MRLRRRLASRLAFAALAISTAALDGCGKRDQRPESDGGRDGSEEARSPFTLDIAVTGCAELDGTNARCSGPAPLVLSFSPVGSPEFTRFSWRFGDGTPMSSERAPVHTYALPGTYEVMLIGAGDVGNIPSNRSVMVVVTPVGVGRPCDIDVQCGGDLRCVCGAGAGCPVAFARGICSSPCDGTACGPGGVCAQLGLELASASDGGVSKSARCLGACETNADCASGFVCQPFPSGGAASTSRWVRGCLPLGALGEPGAPCRSATGALDDTICATGTCADLGALGSCSAACDTDERCPDTTSCARLPDGRQLCLVACAGVDDGGVGIACTRDPLLACSAPASTDGSNLGFQTDAAVGTTFCAPKACTSQSDCAPSGRCGPGGQCVRG